MQRLTLAEYEPRFGVVLTDAQRDALRDLVPSITLQPSRHASGAYDLTAGSWVGVVGLPDLELVIRPKLRIEQVLFLVSYTLDPRSWWQAPAELDAEATLVEAIIPGFVYQTKRAMRRGLHQGYLTVDDALPTIRGRLRLQEQVSRRFGIAPPAEVTFDAYTADIELNRLLRAAIRKLERLPVRQDRTRWPLRSLAARMAGVSVMEYDPRRLPAPLYTRLTEHYRPAVELARLILASGSFELRHGSVAASAFLIDMNRVFENFMVVALREALGVSASTLVQGSRGRPFFLDEARHVPLQPDLSLWDGGCCRFVGDVKYKRLLPGGYVNADLYQAAAYATAAGLPEALLIYAAGEAVPIIHDIVNSGTRLRVCAIDLAAPPEDILAQVRQVATIVTSLARVA